MFDAVSMARRRQQIAYLSCLMICIRSVLAAEILYGLHSNELKSGQLIVPRRVNAHGEFLTHDLIHRHERSYQYEHHRSRRNVANSNDDGERDNSNHFDNVHYHLDVDNETLHLELEPHSYFMAPHLIIERHRRDLRSRKKTMMKNTNCHFHGKVRGHSESRVAISTCEGLVGHIKTKNNEYYIEPSKHHDAHPTNGHPHVVFHRSSVKEKQHHKNKQNHRNDNVAANKSKRRSRKRKQQQQQQQELKQQQLQPHQLQQQQQQKHHHSALVSNCGTREPRRRIETRLEWQPQGKVKIQGGRKIRRHHPQQQQQHRRLHQQQKQQLEQQQQQKHQRHHHQQRHQYMLQQQHQQQQHLHSPQSKFKYQTTTDEINSNSNSNNNNNIDSSSSSNNSIDMDDDDDDDHNSTNTNNGNNNSNNNRNRAKRSISSPRHVEALIVADATMVAFHDNVERYLLTIMNMVSALYKDPSIGNSIEVVVVKIILLEEDVTHPDLNLTQNAQKNLDTFCSWQHKLNTANENDPHHHDVAILITRKNICGNNCMTLGLANVGGMCKPKQSCSVNEDNGIMLSHTVAHELGHNFGMFHDTAKIGCHPRIGSIVHIMTPTFGADTLQVCWSNCSRKYITQFLDQGLGDCLDDAPTPLHQYVYPELPPGVMFNAELQCRLQFNLTDIDVNAASCSSMNEICSTLWCKVNGECVTNMRPTAPGTRCGERKWCQNGKCVRKAEVTPIDGGWGEWSTWSVCSRSCGGGVSIQQRECNNPVPENGGLFCIGERKRYKICNKQPCQEGELSFRAKQCAKYDNVAYQGAIYKWLPFFDKKNPCKLLCTDVDDTIIATWGDTVADGTPCRLGTNDMCIDGICKKVGCDWIVDSDLQDDRCGICGGNGEQCRPVKEIFKENLNVTEGYVEIVTIPAKARHIVIKELSNSANFLGIAKANSSHFYLNGDGLISMPGEFIIAGAESLYDRNDEQESIKIPQPIEHSIALFIIVRTNEPNDGVYYEFTLPARNVSSGKKYFWKLSNWTQCSSSCGGGIQYREPLCYENGKLITSDELCWSFAQNKRPVRHTRTCHDHQCPTHWWAGPWQFCPVTCKKVHGASHVKRRSVMCLDQHEVVVEDERCSKATRPTETENCDEHLPNCDAVAVAIMDTDADVPAVGDSKLDNVILRVRNL